MMMNDQSGQPPAKRPKFSSGKEGQSVNLHHQQQAQQVPEFECLYHQALLPISLVCLLVKIVNITTLLLNFSNIHNW